MSTFFGDTFTQLADEYAYDRRTGVQIVRRWRGTPTPILIQANAARALGLRYDVTEISQGGYQELRVYVGGEDMVIDENTPLQDVWTMASNEVEKSLWAIPKVDTILGSAPSDIVVAVRREAEKIISGDLLNEDGTPMSLGTWLASLEAAGFTSTATAKLGALIRSIQLGEESKSMSQPVLRRQTMTPAPERTKIRPNKTGVDGVISAENLKAGKDPSTNGPIVDEGVLWGLDTGWWLKKAPTWEPISGSQWEIRQEWWHIGTVINTFIFDEYGNT